jgi:sortase A
MGNRSQMRKFRRRRRGAGLVLLMSLAIVVLGVALFFRTDSSQRASGESPVDRVAVPMISEAPHAIVERAAKGQNSQGDASASGKDEHKQQPTADKKPAIPVPANDDLWLTVPSLGIHDAYVYTYNGEESSLDYGPAKLPDTGFPWQSGANTYIAGHRLGWPGTGSDHIFYNLPLMNYGDMIYLTDDNGTVYAYAVTDFKEVLPTESWITNPVAGKNMVSLQTCIENYGDYWTPGPNWFVRFVVRAERVSVTPG